MDSSDDSRAKADQPTTSCLPAECRQRNAQPSTATIGSPMRCLFDGAAVPTLSSRAGMGASMLGHPLAPAGFTSSASTSPLQHGPFGVAPPNRLLGVYSALVPQDANASADITCLLRTSASAQPPHTPKAKLECLLMSPTRRTAKPKLGQWDYGGATFPSAASFTAGIAPSASADAETIFRTNKHKMPFMPFMSSAEVSPTTAAAGAMGALSVGGGDGTPAAVASGMMFMESNDRTPPGSC